MILRNVEYPCPFEKGELWGDFRLLTRKRVNSTNATLIRLSRGGKSLAFCAMMSEKQIKGAGTMGRKWATLPGALALSLVFPPLPQEAVLAPIMIGAICIVRASCELAGIKVGLKPINDIMLGGLKVGGILAQSALNSWGETVLGLGFNCGVKKQDIPQELKNIAGTLGENKIKPCDAATHILENASQLFEEVQAKGMDHLFDSWRGYINWKGKGLRLGTPDGIIEGIFLDIRPDWKVEIMTEKGLKTNDIRLCTI